MTMLTKIGNSQGIRIPKPIIIQANLENKQLDFEVVENGLLIKPIETEKRRNWEENIKEVLLKNQKMQDEAILDDMLDDSDLEDFEW